MGFSYLAPLFEGFGVSFGLIVAIGAQNAFVLRQGLKREGVFVVVLLSALCDAFLTTIGVFGLGGFLAQSPTLTRIACWGGAIFLGWFAVKSFRSAMRPKHLEVAGDTKATSTRRLAAQSLAFSLLNPHAILDTVVMLGGIGAQYSPGPRQVFLVGSVVASFVWFFGLGYGAARLAPYFKKPSVWRVLDTFIGCVMTAIALSLLMKAT